MAKPGSPPSPLDIPPVPPLIPDDPDIHTNTLALLLPHLSLFALPVLSLLKDYYSQYGEIAVWAPVRGFGRVIIVFETEESAQRARREGDYLSLDVNVGGPSRREEGEKDGIRNDKSPDMSMADGNGDEAYFSPKRVGRRSGKGYVPFGMFPSNIA